MKCLTHIPMGKKGLFVTKQQRIAEEYFRDMVAALHENGGYQIIIPTTIVWSTPLPEELLTHPMMRISVSGWAHEVSHVSEDSIYLTVAFGPEGGESEYSAKVEFKDIYEIFGMENERVWVRAFMNTSEKTHTMKSIMHFDKKGLTEGESDSMKAMMKNNPSLFKGNK